MTDPKSLSLREHATTVGPLLVGDIATDADVVVDYGERCGAYRFSLVRAGHVVVDRRKSTLVNGPGEAHITGPHDHMTVRWPAGSQIVGGKIPRGVLDDVLSAAIGWPVTSHIDFAPRISTNSPAGVSWAKMLSLLADQLRLPESGLSNPMVAAPFVDSLMRVLLLAGDHRYRQVVAAQPKPCLPRSIGQAVDIIESEAQLPLTLSELATRSHISVRGLQDGFRRHLGVPPMAYLRQARLQEARKTLETCDPTMTTVSSVASQWGFTNIGRFAVAYAARYGETPAATLRGRRVR